MYRHNREAFDETPIYWPFNIVFVAPLGGLVGSLTGFAKGIALDVEWVLGKTEYGQVFGAYDTESIWRPITLDW